MRREHRPFYLKHARYAFDRMYARHFLYPHFDAVGENVTIGNPWHIKVFGPSITVGKHVNIVATADMKVRLVVWPENTSEGAIDIGDYTIINPGVRISSACKISIGANAMIAGKAYLTDADWHDIYDRVHPRGNRAPICLEENVWVGDSSIICKGVTIGKNSVIGAGSIVTKDIPPNTIACGNPAQVVKQIDPNGQFKTREMVFDKNDMFLRNIKAMERKQLEKNTLLGWLRYVLFPQSGD